MGSSPGVFRRQAVSNPTASTSDSTALPSALSRLTTYRGVSHPASPALVVWLVRGHPPEQRGEVGGDPTLARTVVEEALTRRLRGQPVCEPVEDLDLLAPPLGFLNAGRPDGG